MAHLVRKSRESKEMSQSQVSKAVGFKSGQALSNSERSLCTFPLKKAALLCETLGIDPEKYIEASVQDHEAHLRKVLYTEVEGVSDVAKMSNMQR